MTIDDLAATVDLDAQSYSGYVVSVKRQAQIAQISVTFEVELSSLTPFSPAVWMPAVLTEAGTLVLTGFVDKVSRERQNGDKLIVSGRDRYKLAEDFYITDNELSAKGETVGYWVGTLCGYCGLSYSMLSSGSALTVGYADGEGVPLGMMTVHEALMIICAVPGWNMRMTAAGTLELLIIDGPTAAGAETIEGLSGTFTIGDQDTRNVAKVWGAVNGESSLLYQQRVEIPLLEPDRRMVLSSQGINTLAIATEMAGRLINHFGNLDTVSSLATIGNADRRVGDIVQTELQPDVPHLTVLTDLNSQVGSGGYEQSLATGRKNWAMPYYPTTPIETGSPTLDWEWESVIGEAHDLWITGTYFYVGGWTHLSQNASNHRVWRLEKRLVSTGELVWGVDITDVTNGASPIAAQPNRIWGVYVNQYGVFVSGQDRVRGTSDGNRWRIGRYNPGTGAEVWKYVWFDPGLPFGPVGRIGWGITGDGTYLYGTGQVGTFTDQLAKWDQDGNLIDSVQLARNYVGPQNKEVGNVFHPRLWNGSLLLAARYSYGVGALQLSLGAPWLGRYSLALARIWDYQAPSSALNGALQAVVADENYLWANWLSAFPSGFGGADEGGLYKFSQSGGLISKDLDTDHDGVNLDGSGSRLYMLTHSTGTPIIGYLKASGLDDWSIAPGPTYNAVRFWGQQSKMLVCGRKNSNFYVARYSV